MMRDGGGERMTGETKSEMLGWAGIGVESWDVPQSTQNSPTKETKKGLAQTHAPALSFTPDALGIEVIRLFASSKCPSRCPTMRPPSFCKAARTSTEHYSMLRGTG
jgi:hypothetical protein